MVPEANAHFEPVAWWYTRKKIGRGLAQHYELADDLLPRLLGLISEIGAKPKASAQSSPADNSRAFVGYGDQDSIGAATDRGGSGDGITILVRRLANSDAFSAYALPALPSAVVRPSSRALNA
jgi:hypothetical protein